MVPGIMRAAGAVAEAEPRLKALKKSCDGMESSFLKQMLSAMRRSVDEAKPLGDDTGADTYRGMMDDAVADRLAERGTLGISKMVFHATAGQALAQSMEKTR